LKIKTLLPVLVLLLLLTTQTSGHNSGCGATYCVSLHDDVSSGGLGPITSPETAAISIIQFITIAVVLSQLMLALEEFGHVIPLTLLRALEHVDRLESSVSFHRPKFGSFFWLPIESLSSGRITSKMLRGVAFFGPGRR
jgi:hypothetical protein